MAGLSRSTGTPLSEADHISQSIGDIMTTPVGSRVMRRDYGSYCPDLIDAPGNDLGALRLIAALADGLARWEPRVSLTSASVVPSADGRAIVHIETIIIATGEALAADVAIGIGGTA